MTSDGNLYLLQYGSYINKKVLEENIKKIDDYLVIEEDDKYYVYLGAFVNLETAKKIQKIYENEEIYTYIKNDYYGNNEVINIIKEMDNRILNEEDYHQIKEINKNILDLLKNSVS